MNTLANKQLDKSKEAFLLVIEIYNKPSIKYRIEFIILEMGEDVY